MEKDSVNRLYDDNWFNFRMKKLGIQAKGKFTPFPPITSVLMVPFTSFSPINAKRIWLIINILILIIHIPLIKKISQLSYSWSIILILASGWALANNFRLGQIYLFISLFTVLAFFIVNKDKNFTGGVLIGFSAILKYLPVLFIPVMAIEKKWRFVTGALITILIILIFQILFFGKELNYLYLKQVLLPHLTGRISNQSEFLYQFQSWVSFFNRTFVYDAVHNPDPKYNLPVMKNAFLISINCLIIGSIVYYYKLTNVLVPTKRLDLRIVVTLLGGFVILPASATYHFLLLLLPVSLLLKYHKEIKSNYLIYLFLITYLSLGFIPYGFFYNLGETSIIFLYPRLWLVSVMFILSLIIIHQIIGKKRTKQIV